MDLAYWTRQRTDIIRLFYDKGRVPFEQLKRDIEEEVRPWEPPYFNPETDNPEPAFLAEWMQADQTRELIGMLAVSLLADTLSLYFVELEREIGIAFVDPKERIALFAREGRGISSDNPASLGRCVRKLPCKIRRHRAGDSRAQ